VSRSVPLVFIDATWAITNMTRLRPHADRQDPAWHWKITTFVALPSPSSWHCCAIPITINDLWARRATCRVLFHPCRLRRKLIEMRSKLAFHPERRRKAAVGMSND
jgi:hypothetical protein